MPPKCVDQMALKKYSDALLADVRFYPRYMNMYLLSFRSFVLNFCLLSVWAFHLQTIFLLLRFDYFGTLIPRDLAKAKHQTTR